MPWFGGVRYAYFFFFKQKTAYEMRISDWSSDVCSSDLLRLRAGSMQRFLALGRSVLQRACALVGGRESVCDARLAFVHGLENRRPDELPGERNEEQERDALEDQSSVKVHRSSPLRGTGSGERKGKIGRAHV